MLLMLEPLLLLLLLEDVAEAVVELTCALEDVTAADDVKATAVEDGTDVSDAAGDEETAGCEEVPAAVDVAEEAAVLNCTSVGLDTKAEELATSWLVALDAATVPGALIDEARREEGEEESWDAVDVPAAVTESVGGPVACRCMEWRPVIDASADMPRRQHTTANSAMQLRHREKRFVIASGVVGSENVVVSVVSSRKTVTWWQRSILSCGEATKAVMHWTRAVNA